MPTGPTKYIKIKENPDINLGILYLIESLETQEPAKILIDTKCNQKINKKLSVAKTV